MKDIELLSGEYTLVVHRRNSDFFAAELRHVAKNNFGGQTQTPIGSIYAFIRSADMETFKEHWSVNLYLRTDIQYDEKKRVTLVESRKPKNGPLENILRSVGLQKVSENALYNGKLIEEIGRVLIDLNICHEPMVLEIYHHSDGDVKFYGDVFQGENEDE